MLKPLDSDTLERIGQLSDMADNLVHASTLPLPPAMHVDQLRKGLEQIRDDLRQIFIECGGDPETWQ